MRHLFLEMMTCRQLIEFIAAYVDGELEEEARVEFECHLDHCRSCRAYVDSYCKTMQLVRWILTRRKLGER